MWSANAGAIAKLTLPAKSIANMDRAVNFRFKATCEIITHPQIQKMNCQNELN